VFVASHYETPSAPLINSQRGAYIVMAQKSAGQRQRSCAVYIRSRFVVAP